MRTNLIGVALIKTHEGLRLRVYRDAVGKATIGYGHLLRPGETLTTITHAQAEELLSKDIASAESYVASMVHHPLNDNQFSALVSFVFNLGPGALARSQLLKSLNAGQINRASNQFMRWVYAGGKKLPGLVTRRRAEQTLFLTPTTETVGEKDTQFTEGPEEPEVMDEQTPPTQSSTFIAPTVSNKPSIWNSIWARVTMVIGSIGMFIYDNKLILVAVVVVIVIGSLAYYLYTNRKRKRRKPRRHR